VSTYASLQAANGIDLYRALGISSQASPLEIKVAFRQLAKTLHPDRNAGDKLAEQQFAAVRDAYSILANAEWRAIYDRELALIRAAAAAQTAEQEVHRSAARRRLMVHETLKTAAATVILTACFVAGVSIWQRSTSGPQHTHTMEADVGPPRTHIPTTITSAELADALFGSQASRYGDEAATPSSATIAANNAPAAQSGTVAASREPAVPSEVANVSSEHQPPSEEMTASRAPAAAADEPPATITAAAAIESAPLSARAELTNATSLPPSPAPSVPSKAAADPAARAQAERLVGQGDRQFASGNVAIARLYFARAVDLGFAPAAIKLAETFDAQVLARHGVHGVRPNPAEVEKWRRRAAELGP